ncbi:VOC family protein [Lysinibacillus sp. 54212]|uniref:VOC family protein n=1 Tax=Lysinibacillus sp. 54212 TaxID=3119829 RepID=UPI002FC68C97
MYYLDHIVQFVDQPEAAMQYLQEHGLHTVHGGQHTQWGTYNALSYVGSAYIELIGIYDEEQFSVAAKAPYSLHETYEKNHRQNGFNRIALRTTTIEEDAKTFYQAGYDVLGPERFSRTRPDGSIISWQLLHIGKQGTLFDYPFFIQWDLPEQERMQELTELGILGNHEAGDVEIAEVIHLVQNLEPLYELQKLLQLPSSTVINEESNVEIFTMHTASGNLSYYKPIGEGDGWNAFLDFGNGLHTVVISGAQKEKYITFDHANYVFKKRSTS